MLLATKILFHRIFFQQWKILIEGTTIFFRRRIKNQETIFVAIFSYSSEISLTVSRLRSGQRHSTNAKYPSGAGYQIYLTIRDPIFRRRYATYTPCSTFVAPRQMIRTRRSFRLASAWQSPWSTSCTIHGIQWVASESLVWQSTATNNVKFAPCPPPHPPPPQPRFNGFLTTHFGCATILRSPSDKWFAANSPRCTT